jgi:hypothetical protein
MPLTVNLVSADEAAAQTPQGEVIEEVVILKDARAQRQEREHADRGKFEQAQKILGEAPTELRIAPSSAKALLSRPSGSSSTRPPRPENGGRSGRRGRV